MADAKAEAPETPVDPEKRGKKTILVVGFLMLVEGVGIFAAAKFLLSAEPTSASAVETEGEGATEGVPPPEEEHAPADSHAAASADSQGAKSAGTSGKPGGGVSGLAEIELPECRPTNRMSGKLVLFRLRVSILVSAAAAEKAKALVESNKARISDRLNFVIRSADPQHLNEPGLESVKRRIKHELDRVACDEALIQEVLIPELLQSGTGL